MKTSSVFGQRRKILKESKPKSKYYIIAEGDKTEVQYFEGIVLNSEELKVNPLIDIIPLINSDSEESASHPLKKLKNFEETLRKCKEEQISIKDIKRDILEIYQYDEYSDNFKQVSEKQIVNSFEIFIKKKYEDVNKIITFREASEICKEFLESYSINESLEYFIKVFNDDKIVYDEEIDKVCFIVDRDPQNFKAIQYDEFLKKCKENKFEVYVSNPTFEIFLLMHSDEIFQLDKKEMYENKKNRKGQNGKRYLERELSRIYNGYNKSNLDFDKFKKDIKKAIINEEKFCEDTEELKDKLGTNVGILLKEIIM